MEKLPDWKLYSLEMDKAGKTMGEFFEKEGYDIKRINQEWPGNYKDFLALNIGRSLQPGRKALTVYGDNNFHHFTYGLVKFAERFCDEFCYIHIDHHHDMYWLEQDEFLSCGNFVGQIAKNSKIGSRWDRVMFIGSNPNRRGKKSFSEIELRSDAGLKRLEESLGNMPLQAYVTIDLDVLKKDEIQTSYERGLMDKSQLLELLQIINGRKALIGADVTGYKTGGLIGLLCKGKAQRLYKSIIDIILKNEGGLK